LPDKPVRLLLQQAARLHQFLARAAKHSVRIDDDFVLSFAMNEILLCFAHCPPRVLPLA